MIARLRSSRAARYVGGAVVLVVALDVAAMAATGWLGAELIKP